MTDTKAIERGTYALYALATPNDGDQTVEVRNVVNSNGHLDALPAGGWYWQQFDHIFGPWPNEQAALDAARAHYGY